MSVYRNLTFEQKLKMKRFILGFIIAFIVAELIGFTYTSTIGVSAILTHYIDRGYAGHYQYIHRRLTIQFLAGGICVLCLHILRYYMPNIPDWIAIIITSVIAVTILLPIDFKYKVAPYACTLGNAVSIMVCGIAKNYDFYWQRVMFCIIGAIIGDFVAYVVFRSKDRYITCANDIKSCSVPMAERLIEISAAKAFVPSETLTAAKFNADVKKIQGNVDKINADNHVKKLHRSPEIISLYNNLQDLQKRGIEILNYIEEFSETLSPEFKDYFFERLAAVMEADKRVVINFSNNEKVMVNPINFIKEDNFKINGCGENILMSKLLDYTDILNNLITINNNYLCNENIPVPNQAVAAM